MAGGSRANPRLSNGPLREQSKIQHFCVEYSATCGHTSVAEDMLVSCEAHGICREAKWHHGLKKYSSLTDRWILSEAFLLHKRFFDRIGEALFVCRRYLMKYSPSLAGTRPRGKTEAEDRVLEAELLADEKELAEHNMLVDLGRNDLGKISQFGTVQVENCTASSDTPM